MNVTNFARKRKEDHPHYLVQRRSKQYQDHRQAIPRRPCAVGTKAGSSPLKNAHVKDFSATIPLGTEQRARRLADCGLWAQLVPEETHRECPHECNRQTGGNVFMGPEEIPETHAAGSRLIRINWVALGIRRTMLGGSIRCALL